MAVGILGILAAILIGVSGCIKQENQTDAVLYLDDVAVSAEEYAMLAQEYCNDIYRQYSTDQVNSEKFWETEIDGTMPYEQLDALVLEELKYNYALKNLAVEMDLTEDYTYMDLKESLEEENSSRTDSLEAASEDSAEKDTEKDTADVVYGLTEFDLASYYKYWYSDLETQVSNALIKSRVDVSEEDCRKYYDENAEEFTSETAVNVLYAEIPYEYSDEQGAQDLQSAAIQLKHAMEQTDNVEELSAAFGTAVLENLELNSLDTQSGLSSIYAKRWEIASQLNEGEVYGPYEGNGMLCIVKCLTRTENTVSDYENSKAQIERYLQQQKVQEIIEKEADMEVKEGAKSPKDVISDTLK